MSTNTAFNLPAPVKLRKQWDAHFALADAFLVSASGEDDPPFESDYQLRIHNAWGGEHSGRLPGRDTIIEDEFLTHDPFPVDHPVWLTPEDVAAGRDTVVEAAMQWIITSNESRGLQAWHGSEFVRLAAATASSPTTSMCHRFRSHL